MMMMMMMIMIASFVDSITTPIKSWLADHDDNKTTNTTIKEVRVNTPRVDCIVCLSELALGDRFATLEQCGHGFHVECVEAWLKDHPNCPLCRTPVVSANTGHNHRVYLTKSYEIITRYGFHVMETVATWLTKSFTQGLHSSISESCANYL